MNFTIAIPVYNGEKYVKNAVESCLNQDCGFDYEVLIVDNASTDGTANIIREYSTRAEIVRNEKTVTMFENHNACLRKARGQYVLFCHADDALHENALTILQKEVNNCGLPEKFVIWGKSMFRDYHSFLAISGLAINQVFTGAQSVKPFLYAGLTPSGTCFSRASLLDCGGFVYSSHRLCPNDWITMVKLARRGFKFKMIDRLYFQRKFSSTLPDETPRKDRRESYVDAISELKKVLDDQEFKQIVDISRELKFPPLEFYYGCVRNGIQKGAIKRIVALKLIRNPHLATQSMTARVLFSPGKA